MCVYVCTHIVPLVCIQSVFVFIPQGDCNGPYWNKLMGQTYNISVHISNVELVSRLPYSQNSLFYLNM